MCGASAVAVRNGGKTLHMRAEDLGERCLFGLAQFGKLCCDVRHRAMVLADLHSVADLPRGGRESRRTERVGNSSRRRFHGMCVGTGRGFDVGNDGVDALSRERLDGVVATDLAQLPHGGTVADQQRFWRGGVMRW